MKFGDYIKKGIEIAQLKRDAVQLLADDKEGLGPALAIVAIGGVCFAIGALSPLGIIFMPIVRVIGFFIVIAIMHFVATSFMGGRAASMTGLVVPIGCASIISWIGIIPFIGPVLAVLSGLWLLVVAVITIEYVYQIDRTKAIIVMAVPVVLAIILWFIVFLVVGLSALALLGR
jgi:hypothetical protein